MRTLAEDAFFQNARHDMIEQQLRARGIRDERVLAAMGRIPRQLFADERYWNEVYADRPIPLPAGQSISQPYMVAVMLEALRVCRECKVLEIGTGTGYQAALLGELTAEVVTIERVEKLALSARDNSETLGIQNVDVVVGDGSAGYKPRAPYDRIIVAAAAPQVPAELREQLSDGGILLIPVGASDFQVLNRVTRIGNKFQTERLEACRFVPLIGEHGQRLN